MASIYDQAQIYQIQQANDIVDVVAEHLSLTKKGREMIGVCPFHDDHRPSMYVSPQKQIFKCFACGAGGDVFKFIQMRESLTFPQAIERLAQRAGIKVKSARTASSSDPARPQVDPNELAKVNAWAARHFQANLFDNNKGAAVRKYLEERKLSAESIKKWQLGLSYFQNDLVKAAKTARISEKLLAAAGLVLVNDSGTAKDKFVNRLMFTIAGATGRIIAFGGRTLDNSGAKYINSPATVLFDKSNCIYGLNHARDAISASGTAVVVEGYTYCIMAHQFGCKNVVATLGTSFTPGHARILKRHAKRVVLLYDSDVAGTEAANRAIEICLDQYIDIKIAFVPQGKDPCDFLLSAGKGALEQLLTDAVDVFQFKWNRLVQKFGSDDTFAGNKAATDEFLRTVTTAFRRRSMTSIERGLMINQLVSKIAGHGLDAARIKQQLYRQTAGYNQENRKVQQTNLGQGFFAAAQQEIIEVLLNEPALFETVKEKISVDDFDVPILKDIAAILFEALKNDINAPLAAILARAETVEAGNAIVRLAEQGEQKGNYQPRLTGALDAVKRHRNQAARTRIRDTDGQVQLLKHMSENATKRNPHNVGMM